VIVQGTSVGLDVHALSVVAHAVDEETGKVARARLCPDHGEVLGWLHQLRAPVRVTYEGGRPGSGWRGRSPRPGWNAWLPHPRSCSVRPGIGSRPMPVMPRIWPGCYALVRSPQCGCPSRRLRRSAIWCGPVKMPAPI
jgi:hypothetical protein